MKEKLLKNLLVILLIFSLTMVNFIFVSVNMVTYAADLLTQDSKTNNANVKFIPYFKNDNGERVSSLNALINAENLKLCAEITVEKGYLTNGKIEITDSNFNLKQTNELSNSISSINGNTINLNTINSGDKVEIEVDIEVPISDYIDVSLLGKESKIKFTGTYKDSNGNDNGINSEKKVTLNLKSESIKEDILLEQSIITNKVLEVNGENKKVVQVLVKSGLKDGGYPIKETEIAAIIPKIEGHTIESYSIQALNTYATNGKTGTEFSTSNWKHNSEYVAKIEEEKGKQDALVITVKNEPNAENKISWNKEGKDEFIITYIFDENAELDQTEFSVYSSIKLYDDRTGSSFRGQTKNNEELYDIAKVEVKNQEDEIYNGKLYANIDRDIKNTTKVQINFAGLDTINLEEEKSYYTDKENNQTKYDANIIYKEVKIAKTNFDYIFGNSGYIVFKDENGDEIARVTNLSQVRDGYIVVDLQNKETKSIKAEITGAVNIGELVFEETKTIKTTSNVDIKNVKSIKYKTKVNGNPVESEIQLKDSEFKTEVVTEPTTIDTFRKHDMKIKATLVTDNESKRLYSNPTLDIEIPSKITEIEIKNAQVVQGGNVLAVKNTKKENNHIIVELEGVQTEYTGNTVRGIEVDVDVTLGMKNTEVSSDEIIKISVKQSEETVSEATQNIKIEALQGLITVNSLQEYGIEALGIDNEQSATLAKSTEAKNANVKMQLINNAKGTITNVTVLGKFPTENNKVEETTNNIKIAVGEITLEGIEGATVQYSEDVNATAESNWTDAISNPLTVKSYKIVIPEMSKGDRLSVTYGITIPEGLEYNQTSKHNYDVTYFDTVLNENKEAKGATVTLETGVGPVVETEMTASVGGQILEQGAEVRTGEVIKYIVTVKNVGSEDANGVQLTAKVPEGTTYVTPDKRTYTGSGDGYDPDSGLSLGYEGSVIGFYIEDASKTEIPVTFDIEKGKNKKLTYEVRVNDTADNSKIKNQATMVYGEVTKKSNETEYNVKHGNIRVISKLMNTDKDRIMITDKLYYYVVVENTSNELQRDVKVNLNMSGLDIVGKVEVCDIVNEEEIKNKTEINKTSQIALGNIEAGAKKLIRLYAQANDFEEIYKDVKFSTIVSANNATFRSNEFTQRVYNYLLDIEISATNENGYLQANDTVEYTIKIKNNSAKTISGLKIEDKIPNNLYISKVEQDVEDITKNNSRREFDLRLNDIEPGETTVVKITTIVDPEEIGNEPIELINEIFVKFNGIEIEKETLTHIIKPNTEEVGNSENVDEPGQTDSPENTDESGQTDNSENSGKETNPNYIQNSDKSTGIEKTRGYMISGIAWQDENKNGKKDSGEKLLKDVKVCLMDIKLGIIAKDVNGKELTTNTNNNGLYIFKDVPNGEYLVVFEYDSNTYRLTDYQKSGLAEYENSNVISKKLTINGTEKNYAVTNTIAIKDNNVANINMGICEIGIFDLKLEKYVTKILVQNNNETDVYNYDKSTLAKVELDSKKIAGSTVIVEYTIKVTNNGELEGYVKNIVDYIPSGLKFSSELNKEWYQSGSYLYNASLANTKLAAGESRTVTLVLTKAMTENNTGRINNTAEIAQDYNEVAAQDINSVPGNKTQGENDMASADIIISIRTGSAVTYIALTIAIIAVIGAGTYFIKKKVLKERI